MEGDLDLVYIFFASVMSRRRGRERRVIWVPRQGKSGLEHNALGTSPAQVILEFRKKNAWDIKVKEKATSFFVSSDPSGI
jgi:hypothetical protein